MPRAPDALFDDGLAALASLLPAGYLAARASLPRRPMGARHWLVLRQVGGKATTCQVVVRRRVEGRDVPGIARQARAAQVTTVVLAPLLSRTGRSSLLAAGIGSWDLAGNASIELPMLGLHVERDGRAPARAPKRGGLRSLGGEMAGRMARALIDRRPPYSPAELAVQARVDRSYACRLLGFLAAADLLARAGRGRVASVAWRALLERWAGDAPPETRGRWLRFRAAAPSGFLPRLARSGLLHALTGPSAFALVAETAPPVPSYLYVDDVPAAAAQLGLRAVSDAPDVVLIEPADHSVFHRSCEQRGLRYVSPSLMAADTEDRAAFATVVQWLTTHEAAWRK